MISCSPTSSDTAAHNLDTASNPSSQSHFTKDIPSNVLQVRTRSTTKKSHHCQVYLHIPNEILYEFPNSGLNYFRVAGFCFVQKRNINNYYIMYGNLIKYRAIISFISVVKNQVN